MPNLDLDRSTGRIGGCSHGGRKNVIVGVLVCALCLVPLYEAGHKPAKTPLAVEPRY